MIMIILLLLLLLLVSLNGSNSNSNSNKECEQLLGSQFTSDQKHRICSLPSSSSSTSTSSSSLMASAKCAIASKTLPVLRNDFDTIYKLCCNISTVVSSSSSSSSAAGPIDCYNTLIRAKPNQRNLGILLCAGSSSALPSQCYTDISSYKGTHQVDDDKAIKFCSNLDDHSPLACAKAAAGIWEGIPIPFLRKPAWPLSEVLSDCKAASGNEQAIVQCLKDMLKLGEKNVNRNSNTNKQEIIQFCEHAIEMGKKKKRKLPWEKHMLVDPNLVNVTVTSPLAACYELASLPLNTGLNSPLTVSQRLTLCTQADSVGPAICMREAVLTTKLSADEVVDLCLGSTGIGPVNCFTECKSMSSNTDKIELCVGAPSSGPAKCYRHITATSARFDEYTKKLLCIGVNDMNPAICAANAPHYLLSTEKVQLCGGNIVDAMEPVKCLQGVEASSYQTLYKAPSKVLGYFYANLGKDEEKMARDLMIHMCSFEGSRAPMASSHCLKMVPRSLMINEAIRLCTNVSSTEVASYMAFCAKVLPKDWSAQDTVLLCDAAENRQQVEAVIKCSNDIAIKFRTQLSLNKTEVALLCKKETNDRKVDSCLQEVVKGIRKSAITTDLLISICGQTRTKEAGMCLAKATSYSQSQMLLDDSMMIDVCNRYNALDILVCLEHQNKRVIQSQDLDMCTNIETTPTSVKVVKILSSNNDVHVTAGQRFSMHFQLYDQWGLPLHRQDDDVYIHTSINDNNEQGAVLWGTRSNYTLKGLLQLNYLTVSQPGMIKFKVSYKPSTCSSTDDSSCSHKTLEILNIVVKPDPNTKTFSKCLDIFRAAECNAGPFAEDDYNSDFPKIKGYISPKYLFSLSFGCMDTLTAWYVDFNTDPSGSTRIEFRSGKTCIQ